VKTTDLQGAALDWAVANCEGLVSIDTKNLFEPWYLLRDYTPSTDWAQGGPIIERERIELVAIELGEEWIARDYWKEFDEQSGPTPLVAAMRCYVASKLGDEVEIPAELMEAA